MKNIYLILILGLILGSCTDNFDDLNIDTKNPSAIPAEPLFSSGVRVLFDEMSDCSVNQNVFRLYSQYWSQTTYPDESQYNMTTRNIPSNFWNTMYRDVLRDLQEAKSILNATEYTNSAAVAVKDNKIATINLVEAYTYAVLVDVFGDIPYTEALDINNISPKYDDAKTVYGSVISNLEAAIAALDTGVAGFDSSADIVYGGDVAAWKAFGNSLLLKLALRMSQDGSTDYTAQILQGAADGISSAAGAFSLDYYSAAPNTNPVYAALVLSGRSDFLSANTLVDFMNGLEDPRRTPYFDDQVVVSIDSTVMPPVVTMGYKGGTYGDANVYANFTKLGERLHTATTAGNLLSMSEVNFLKAEAAAMGFAVGDAETFYNNAVMASMNEWGVDPGTYMSQPGVAWDAANWRSILGKQKWVAMFNNGFEGWSTWRIYDFADIFNVPPGLTYGDIPTRMTYPVPEATLNGANMTAAGSKYGNNSATAKIFWDVN